MIILFKELLFLLLGAVLGNIDKIISAIKCKLVYIYGQKRKKFNKKVNVYEWLIKYYENKKTLYSLFDCKIGNFEIKIPFITKQEWQTNINITQENIIEYLESINNFSVNKKWIKQRKILGQKLFNEPTLYLERISFKNNDINFVAKKCNYYEVASNLIELEEETYRAIKNSKKIHTPIRDEHFINIETVSKFNKKPFSFGCTVALLFKTDTNCEILIHTRSHQTITYGGKLAVIPNFGLTIPNRQVEDVNNIIEYNFIKEYCEELFDYEEIISMISSNRSNFTWIYNLPEAKEILKLKTEKNFELHYIGFGVDAFNGTSNIALAAIIKDISKAKSIKSNIVTNWEVDTNEANIEFIDLYDARIQTWLKENRFQYGSAFTIARIIELIKEKKIII